VGFPQQFLYFLPLPHQHDAFRPSFCALDRRSDWAEPRHSNRVIASGLIREFGEFAHTCPKHLLYFGSPQLQHLDEVVQVLYHLLDRQRLRDATLPDIAVERTKDQVAVSHQIGRAWSKEHCQLRFDLVLVGISRSHAGQ